LQKRRKQNHSSQNEINQANSRIHFYEPQKKYRCNEGTKHRTNHEFHTDLTELTGNTMFLGCPIQEFHFKCYIINQKGKRSTRRHLKQWNETIMSH
jgi:hypothetical protein